MTTYPICDWPNAEERKALGVSVDEASPMRHHVTNGVKVCAIFSGEKRSPRAGEWYLSGAIIEAYRAPKDLSSKYHIARLVKVQVKTETTTIIMTEIVKPIPPEAL